MPGPTGWWCSLAGLGPALSDALTVYHATHGNVTGAGALDVSRLSEARQKLREQVSLDGIKMNVMAAILLVSAASETAAEQLTAPLQPAQVSNANPFQGKLAVVADSNLSGTRFYVLGDPARGESNYIYGFLGGAGGPALRDATRLGSRGLGGEDGHRPRRRRHRPQVRRHGRRRVRGCPRAERRARFLIGACVGLVPPAPLAGAPRLIEQATRWLRSLNPRGNFALEFGACRESAGEGRR
jgi:hypothetical protein